MKYGKVLTYKDAEEAKKLVGKEVVCSDYLSYIEDHPQLKGVAILKDVTPEAAYPFMTNSGRFQFICEIIEEPELMTNRQLSEWCAKGNGLFTHPNSGFVFTDYPYRKAKSDELVPDDIRIRPWDSEEWVLPTVEIYERDCKGGS